MESVLADRFSKRKRMDAWPGRCYLRPRRHSMRPRHGAASENKSKNINALPVPLPRQVCPEARFCCYLEYFQGFHLKLGLT